MDLTDRALIDAITGNDSKNRVVAFQDLYRKNFNSIKNFVVKNRGTDEDAKDIFQDGLIVVYRNLMNKSFNEDSKVSTYLFSICKNLWFQKIRNIRTFDALQVDSLENLSEEINVLKIDTDALNKLLNDLKEECKQLLIDFYYEHKSMKDLMETFHLGSEQAAKNKKHRCLNSLIEMIKARGITQQNFFE